MNLINLHQDRFQDIRLRDQEIAIKKVCNELELYEGGPRSVLREICVTDTM